MVRTIAVVEYDPAWLAAFEREASALGDIFQSNLVALHHIGSTAVPGLAAKPIIDILVLLTETATIERYSAGMTALGYRVRGECLEAEVPGTPGRFYYSKDSAGVRTHQAHVCATGHPQVPDLLAFRDYLRAHPTRAHDYGVLKRALAAQFRHDSVGYMRGKGALIQELLAEARTWLR
jgi:GrpB-like predicted nucleotidyltransferase (UPF0157 family)